MAFSFSFNRFRSKQRDAGKPVSPRRLHVESLESRQLLTTVGINPVADNTLIEEAEGASSNGSGHVFVGLNDDMNIVRRGLLDFDIAANVPAGATINSVELTMWVNKTHFGDRDVALHRVLADWGEAGSFGGGDGSSAQAGDATWLHTFHNDEFWDTPGGDFSATSSAVQTIGVEDAFYSWSSTPQMVADVQGWLDNPDTAHGWLLLGDETNSSSKRFSSRESNVAEQRPLLTIDYTEATAQPAMSVSDVTITEGDMGTVTAQFDVTLSVASDAVVTVEFATADGTAVAGADYQATDGALTFAPGQTVQSISVPVSAEALVELDETFTVHLSNPAGATIADDQGVVAIINDDSATISIDSVTLAEGDAGTTDFLFTVTLDAAIDVPLQVDFFTADGTATTDDNDYLAASGTLTFAGQAGESQTVTVTVNGDENVEPDQSFAVHLANAAADARDVTIAGSPGVGTIRNDDGALTVRTRLVNLMGRVREIGDSGILPRSQVRKMSKTLEEAIHKLDDSENRDAAEKVQKFIKNVNELTRKGVLSGALAEELTAAGDDIVASLRDGTDRRSDRDCDDDDDRDDRDSDDDDDDDD